MSFMDSYKRLEKLCGEILGNERPVKTYIEEMKKYPQGARYVSRWDDDLAQLKHYLWVRNKISHDPGCSEENMCQPNDAAWLDAFYLRIMNQKDPLTLYRIATQPKKQMNFQTKTVTPKPSASKNTYAKGRKKGIGYFVVVIIVILEILALLGIFWALKYLSGI